MVPIYSFLMIHNYEILYYRCSFFNKTNIFLLFWFLCSAATLILTPLFEMRYFVVPWVFLSLEVVFDKPKKNKEGVACWTSYVYYGAINATVLYVFIKRPFINIFMGSELSRLFW
jgi:hypothetical protein